MMSFATEAATNDPTMPDSVDIAHLKTRLVEIRAQILALQDTRNASAATVELDQSSVGRLSPMDALQQQAMAQAGQERAARELLRIEAARRRCEDGSYGYCLDCDEPIDPRRLELDPATPLCVRCTTRRGG